MIQKYKYAMVITVIREFICDTAGGRDDGTAKHVYSFHNPPYENRKAY